MKLLEKGLDVHLLQRAGATPVCDVYVTADGDRTMFGYGFHHEANHTPFDVLPFKAGHWFTADPNIPNASRIAAKIAHTKKMKLYLMDFNRDNEIIPKGAICQFGTDSVGERGNCEANLNWVGQWTAKHSCTTILTDGGLGLFVAEPGQAPMHLPAFPPTAVVDSTGAGDAFRAGTLYGLIHKRNLLSSICFGAATASLKVAHIGATENVPSLKEVESWIKAHPDIAQAYDV
jgi:sugar/nucleoside kinase (ribokinase family)